MRTSAHMFGSKSLVLTLLAASMALHAGCVVKSSSDDGAGGDGAGGEAPAGGAGGMGGTGGMPAATGISCADVLDDPADAELLDKDLNAGDAVELAGTYRVTGGRRVVRADFNIDIAPGTVFFVDNDSWLAFYGDATLRANGTADDPILFCPINPSPGSWEGVEINYAIASDSVLEHVRIEQAGGGERPALRIQNEALLRHVAVVDSADIGIEAEGLAAGSEGIVSTGHAYEPMLLTGHRAITNLPLGTYTPNGVERIAVQGFENEDVTFHNVGVPYFQQEDSIRFGDSFDPPTVRFEAGVEYQFQFDSDMIIGAGGSEAAIQCEGTADQPVVFTSDGDAGPPGAWQGMRLSVGTLSSSTIDHCEFRYGGGAESGNLRVVGAAVVQNSHFAHSAGSGIVLDAQSADLLGTGNNTFEGNPAGDITAVTTVP